MSSDVFEFRDFSMRQAPSGQRINTDSCVFGGLLAEGESPKRVLDIGAGTGVLSLMLARRFAGAAITALEPDREVSRVARENFAASPWASRLTLIEEEMEAFAVRESGDGFDLVVCNPPYIQGGTPAADPQRALARHTGTLTPEVLFPAMGAVMKPGGSAWTTMPFLARQQWQTAALLSEFYPKVEISLKDHPEATPHLAVMGWSRVATAALASREVAYRQSSRGPLSDWMREFRSAWYPARFNPENPF